MNRDGHRLEPAFDFVADESSVLLHQSQAEIEINGKHYAGDVEVRLDLLPRANVYLYGQFKDNVINLVPNSLFCLKISSIHHHLKESDMSLVPAVPTTDQAVFQKII